MNKPWIGDLTNSAVNAYQAADLPSNTQTAYNFTLNYDEGKLIGMVNIKQNYADPTKQQVTQDKLEEITFVKRDETFYASLKNVFENQPDILKMPPKKSFYADKHGVKVSRKEIVARMRVVDVDLANQYKKAVKRENYGGTAMLAGLGLELGSFGFLEAEQYVGVALSVSIGFVAAIGGLIYSNRAGKKQIKLVEQYNNQIIQRKNKPTAELKFGITPSGGIGLTFNF
jgi:hypothetical protein